jgi:8-oxo-dGTP pyrophosphatase MutT (NUDIX family)
MAAQLIQSLLPHLPRFAEEEGDFYSVPRQALIDALVKEQIDRTAAETCVSVLETLLDTLAVLDKSRLQNGEWCFASFPAQLLATSVLTAMSDADSRLFPVNFWNTRDIADDRKDQQCNVLRWIEQARCDQHATGHAPPIRFIYVAWSIIKLDGKILFYQREDTKKRFDKASGDYGLPGGRANQNDILGVSDSAQMLAALQAPNSDLVLNALPSTLQRELREEAGLRFGEHYQFSLWRRLKPYRQVQGVAPNHALTEYYLDVFQIQLTLEGFLFLPRRIAGDERLAWLTLEDIARGESNDGKIPYIKALFDDFEGDRAALVAALHELPDSFAPAYRLDRDNYGIILSLSNSTPIAAGKLGKEKPLALTLSPYQAELLLGLAAHLRGFVLVADKPSLLLHPFGWIEVVDDSVLQRELCDVAAALKDGEIIVEVRRERYFRLSIRPDLIYFDDSLFAFIVDHEVLQGVQSKISVTISRRAFATVLGKAEGRSESFKLTLELANKLIDLAERQFTADNELAVKIEDAYKKGLDQEPRFKALGLRKLVHREDGMMRFAATLEVR